MKSNGWEPERLRVHFGVGQARRPLRQIVQGELKRMKNGAARGGNIGVRRTQPWFGVGGGGRRSSHWQFLKGRIVREIEPASRLQSRSTDAGQADRGRC